MEELHNQVRRARRLLAMQRFVAALGWCWFGTLTAALALIAVDKLRPLGVDAWAWAAGALGLGLVAAILWTLATRPKALAAAIEVDRRYGLKERVSSAWALPREQQETEIGRALMADAVRRVERIDVAEKFAVSPPRQLLLPLLPGLLALLAAVLISPAGVDNPAEAGPEPAKGREQIKKASESLHRKLVERREQAEKQGLKDAEQLLKKIEESTRKLAADPPERKKALTELNDLSRELQGRRRALDGAEQVKQQLEQLKRLDRGPADKFAEAVHKGDFQKAVKELEKLKAELANSELNDEQKQQLAKQLDEMKQKLDKLAEARKAAQADLQQRADQLRQAGQTAEADQIEEQLKKLAQQAAQGQQLDDLAEKLGQCSKCLKNGQPQDAAEALSQLGAGLGKLQDKLDELESLDEAMGQLSQARAQMNCSKCGGAGCEACQGGFGAEKRDGPPGMGLGAGQGQGDRPESKNDTDTYDSRVRQKVGPGAADVVDMVPGPNVKGNVEQEIKQQFDSARQGSTDPLSGRRIPRKHRQQAQEYFDRFREGK